MDNLARVGRSKKKSHACWRKTDTTSTIGSNPRSSVKMGLPRCEQRTARTCQSQKSRNYPRLRPAARKYRKQTQGIEYLYFCIVHSCIITCIPSSKTLPPGRLLNFTWNSLGELPKITFTSIQINPLNVSLSEKKFRLISCLENPILAALFSFKVCY